MFTQDGEEEEFKDLAEEDDDEEERFEDADKLQEGASAEKAEPKPTASWVHHQNLEGQSVFLLIIQSQICHVT